MSADKKKIGLGDTVVVNFGFENTGHQVLNVVDDMVKITPKHCMMGDWAPRSRIEASFTPCENTPLDEPLSAPEKKVGFFSRLFK